MHVASTLPQTPQSLLAKRSHRLRRLKFRKAFDTGHKHDIRENVGYQSSSPNGQPTACTPGTKATTDLSGEWQPRLLIGGCMISTDSWHTGWEEVHLPDACHSNVPLPADLGGIGCMDKGANNFNAAARQPGKCKYSNTGCTD